MADNYRFTKTTVTGVTNTGNNSARIFASEAEKKATEALLKAEEALKAVANGTGSAELLAKIKDLTDRLEAEIARSTLRDDEHSGEISNLVDSLEVVDSEEINIWSEEENN